MPNIIEITTPLGVKVTCPREYWHYIVSIKHPIMKGKENLVSKTLEDPDEIRRSKIDVDVYLYYRMVDRLYCGVAKHADENGFLITAYPTEKVKEGEIIWTK